MKDLAGNEAQAYPEDHFVIDRTAPSLTISDILNESANKGEVSPKISYGDRYLDQDALSLKLVGEVHGEHGLSSQQGGSISIARTDALNLPMQNRVSKAEAGGERGHCLPKLRRERRGKSFLPKLPGGTGGGRCLPSFRKDCGYGGK